MKARTIVIGGITLGLAIFIYGAAHRSPVGLSLTPIAANNSEAKPAPDFELKSLYGRSVKLSDLRGKAVLLNFWATYCTPCRVEIPWLIDLYRQYQGQGLEIVGISMDDAGEQQQVADFTKEINVNYQILLGNHAVGDAYGGTQFLPKTFFIDRNGRITSSAIGLKTKSEFESAVKELLAAAPKEGR